MALSARETHGNRISIGEDGNVYLEWQVNRTSISVFFVGEYVGLNITLYVKRSF
jgi:hypothetical protein